jgi:hypothetical protein
MSSVVLRGRWCDIIVLDVHATIEDKIDYKKKSLYEEQECVFDKFPKYHTTFLLGDFSANPTRVEVGSNTSTVTLRVVRGDEMGLKKAEP